MKNTLLFLAALITATGLAAQNPTTYFMEGSTLRSQLNPAFAPLRGYVNIPGLGGIQVNQSGNIALDNILYPRDGKLVTLLDSSVSAADALTNLKTDNLLGADTRINLIGFGAYTKNRKNFWSFDLNLRANVDANLPYSLFEFAKKGTEGDIRNVGVTVESYLEAGFNYSFPLLDDKLYIGVRGKFLAGAARGRLNYDHFNVTLDEDRWQIDATGSLDLTAAGTTVETSPNDQGEQVFQFKNIDMKPEKPAGYGFAVDLGATYDILPNLQASFAVNDLGFICWSGKHTVTGRSSKQMVFNGIDIPETGAPQPDFDLNILEFTPVEAQSSTRMLHASVNAGIEYELWRHKIGIGLLYTARIWEYTTLHNITGSVNFHPVRWFTLTGSYTVIGNRGGVFGLALNLHPGWINFFVATDVLTARHTPQWIPVKQTTMNLTLGLGIPIGKHGHRIPAYIRP